MSDLQVSAWQRYGQDRLYVNRPDGESVAWFDRRTGQIKILVEVFRDAALEALAPHLSGHRVAPPPAPGTPPPMPPRPPEPAAATAAAATTTVLAAPAALPPEYDLARNRPGEALRARVRDLSPGPYGRLAALVLRRRTEADSWRDGLAGERAVAGELKRLPRDWRVLHSIPLPRDVDIDHLLIGPGGVFTINTKNHRGKDVWVGDDSVKVNHGEARPYVRKARAEASRAARALERGCRFPVPVQPVLAFVRPAALTVEPSLHDVRAVPERSLSALGPLTGVLTADQVRTVYEVARDRRTWLGA